MQRADILPGHVKKAKLIYLEHAEGAMIYLASADSASAEAERWNIRMPAAALWVENGVASKAAAAAGHTRGATGGATLSLGTGESGL